MSLLNFNFKAVKSVWICSIAYHYIFHCIILTYVNKLISGRRVARTMPSHSHATFVNGYFRRICHICASYWFFFMSHKIDRSFYTFMKQQPVHLSSVLIKDQMVVILPSATTLSLVAVLPEKYFLVKHIAANFIYHYSGVECIASVHSLKKKTKTTTTTKKIIWCGLILVISKHTWKSGRHASI